MATCPGTPAVPNEPTTTLGVTTTPNLPQPKYSSNASDPFPVVSWTPADEFCSFQFQVTPGNEFIVPTQQWDVNWRYADNVLHNDTQAGVGNAAAAGFGVTLLSATPVTGPASSGPIAVGSDTVTITIVSGTVRVSMANGSLFGYLPGDPVSNAVIRYEWSSPVHGLQHLYYNNGSDQTPVGITNYQTSAATDFTVPEWDCTVVSVGLDSATVGYTLASGTVVSDSSYTIGYNTVPGGPWPLGIQFGLPLPAGSTQALVTFTGLTPGTQYWYNAGFFYPETGDPEQLGGECSFTTLPAPVVECLPVTVAYQTDAELPGQLSNGVVGQTITVEVARTAAVPTPYSLVATIPADGSPVQNFVVVASGLTSGSKYKFKVTLRDANNQVVDVSDECEFCTPGFYLRGGGQCG